MKKMNFVGRLGWIGVVVMMLVGENLFGQDAVSIRDDVSSTTGGVSRPQALRLLSAGLLTNIVYHGHREEVFASKMIYGAPLGSYMTLGPGIGYERFVNANLLPLFIDFRVCPLEKDGFLHLFTQFGYSALLGGAGALTTGGWRFSMGGGITLPLGGGTAALFDVGYEHQPIDENIGPAYLGIEPPHRTLSFDIVSATLGFSF